MEKVVSIGKYRNMVLDKILEKDFQKDVLEVASMYGWRVAHFRSVRVQGKKGSFYATPIDADGKGFPDLTLVRDEWCIWAELKSQKGRLSNEQKIWLEVLGRIPCPTTMATVWRPKDMPEIIDLLRR